MVCGKLWTHNTRASCGRKREGVSCGTHTEIMNTLAASSKWLISYITSWQTLCHWSPVTGLLSLVSDHFPLKLSPAYCHQSLSQAASTRHVSKIATGAILSARMMPTCRPPTLVCSAFVYYIYCDFFSCTDAPMMPTWSVSLALRWNYGCVVDFDVTICFLFF